MADWRNHLSLFVGAMAGTFMFLLLCTLLVGSPIRDAMLSAHGILVRNSQEPMSQQQVFEVDQLLKHGLLITSDGLIASMQSFYQTLVGVLVGGLALLGVFSVVYASWRSRAQIDEVVSDRTAHGLKELMDKKSFHDLIRNTVDSALQIEMESYDETVKTISEYVAKVAENTRIASENSSPEEMPVMRAKINKRKATNLKG